MKLTEFAHSAPFLLVLSFPFSRSEWYPQAVSLARRALQYREMFVAGRLMHLCGFGTDRAGAMGAVALLERIGSGRSLCVATEWGECHPKRSKRVLLCYLAAPVTAPPGSYCRILCRLAEASGRRGTSVLPCRLLKPHFTRKWHPGEAVAPQLVEAAASAGVAVCPLWRSLWREQVAVQDKSGPR